MGISLHRLKTRLFTKLLVWFPSLKEKAVQNVPSVTFRETPWHPFRKPLTECRLTLIATAGIHLKSQVPFDMKDPSGDPTYRQIPSGSGSGDLKITHDYFDHKDADRDINIVFPADHLRDLVKEGKLGSVSAFFFGFMGHITDHHVDTLLQKTGPEVARKLKQDQVDVALLTPG